MQSPGNRLRATRASPPGLASSDPDRRATYAAALQQFDDLIGAAGAIGPVSRPLPLYYAVHQAGKAVVAAWAADKWRVKGHGLIQVGDDDEDRPSAWQSDILRFQVKPYRKRPGVLDAVASTLGTARLTGSVELGALWSALPEASPHPDASSWPLALPVYPHSYESAVPPFVSPAFRGFVCLRGLPAPEDAAVMNRLLAMLVPRRLRGQG